MVQFCCLRLYLSIETVSCYLLQQMARWKWIETFFLNKFSMLLLLFPDEVILFGIFITFQEHFVFW